MIREEEILKLLRIPEANRSSAEQRKVVEWEWAQERRPVQTPHEFLNDVSIFEAWERFLVATAHLEGYAGPYDPQVAKHAGYMTFLQFQLLSAAVRHDVIRFTDIYFDNNPELVWP